MAGVTTNSLAAATTSSVQNKTFLQTAQAVKRKLLIIGTGNPAKEAGLTLDTPILVTSPEDVANKTGGGYMLHRLSEQAFKGAQNSVETYISVQAEDGGGAQSAGSIDFAGSTGVLAGTLSLYISGILDRPVGVTTADADTPDNLATKTAAAINAITELPVTATALTTVVTVTAKSVGTWGDDIDISTNLLAGDVDPTGVTYAIIAMTGGSSTDDIGTALDGLGTGDGANEDFYTDVIHGYGSDTTQLNAISTYVGPGNDKVGLYSELVHKPFRSLSGDTTAGSGGLTAAKALGDGRKTDRANGVISVPGSASHPQEIAAQTMGIMARISNNRPEQTYAWQLLSDIDPGAKADRWTSEYSNRDSAVSSGVSPTFIQSGNVAIQNVVTFYHPDDVPQTSNGYRSMRNISIIQNLLDSQFKFFSSESWQGISIVANTARVTNVTAREKTRDISAVIGSDIQLVESWESNAWIYEKDFPIARLQNNPPTIRTGADGFTNNLKVILSGEGLILQNNTDLDVSIAVLSV